MLSFNKRMRVLKKTECRCSICGSTKNIDIAGFIPAWTRLSIDDIDNAIPMCDDCKLRRGVQFIELGKLQYLPELYIQQLMRYYKSVDMYLYKYVRLYGMPRTNNKLDLHNTILIMNTYNMYIKEHKDEIDWENL